MIAYALYSAHNIICFDRNIWMYLFIYSLNKPNNTALPGPSYVSLGNPSMSSPLSFKEETPEHKWAHRLLINIHILPQTSML